MDITCPISTKAKKKTTSERFRVVGNPDYHKRTAWLHVVDESSQQAIIELENLSRSEVELLYHKLGALYYTMLPPSDMMKEVAQ